MTKMKIALLGVLALIIASGIATSAASASGPYWHVSGKKLGQGESRQVKLQMKGIGIITFEISESVNIQIECRTGFSEGMTIAGQGNLQGQGKGRLTFIQCQVVKPQENCAVREPVRTNQLKSLLAINPNNKQRKYAELFTPQQGAFLVIGFTGAHCPLGEIAVNGSIAAEVMPTDQESQEGLLSFPETPITELLLEEQAVKFALEGGLVSLGAYFGARLATGEPWGAFGQ